MLNTRMRLLIIFIAFVSFAGPFAAVVAVENAKRAEKLLSEKQENASAQKEAETARYQYYLDLAERRNSLKASMAEAKAQYEQLLKDQPDLIKQGQHTVTQTTVEPVVTQKIVSTPVTTSTPKSSTKTKSS